MEIDTMTLQDLISEYQFFLKENISSKEIIDIASAVQKHPVTIKNYLDYPNRAKDFLTMKGIVEVGLKILEKRGITK